MRSETIFQYLRIGLLVLLWDAGSIVRGSDVIHEGLAALAEGNYEQAAATLADFVSKHPEHPDVAQAMCGSAQSLCALGRDAEALEFFEAALERRSARLREAPIRLACAKCAISLSQFAAAADHATQAIRTAAGGGERAAAYAMLVSALCQDARCSEAWSELQKIITSDDLNQTVKFALAGQIGANALPRGEAGTAREAFSWQLENTQNPREKAAAALGYAWAQSALATEPADAANALLQFVDQHPEASGASRVLLAAARKQVEANRSAGAIDLLKRLVADYPDSAETIDALALMIQLAQQSDDSALAVQSRSRLVRDHPDSPAARDELHIAISDAANSKDDVLFDSIAAGVFGSADRQLVSRTLDRLNETTGNEVVLRFADAGLRRLIDPQQHAVTATIIDWLFEHEQWSVITEAAGNVPADVLVSNIRQGTVIAESMHRLGNPKAAYDLFTLLAAQPEPKFVVSLRRSELAVQVGSVEEAKQAILDAERVAASPRDQQYVQIVSAQLAIRRAEFDAARKLLDAVVVSTTADQRLRGRAQWLLGETYFMQRDYSAAIDAYRRCETMFPESGWSAAALLQAGKSFEKLGNFRDAAVCYTSLLNKHANSPYARLATRRLGWIGKENTR